MATTKHNLIFTIFTIITTSNAKNIKLEIDSTDLISIINSVLQSETLQSIASSIMRRNIPNQSMYNPYHPEDGVVEPSGSTVETTQRNRNSGSKNISKEKKKLAEESLETDNENFIKGVGNKSEEILVVDSASPDEVKVISIQDLEKKNGKATEKEKSSNQKFDDRFNYRNLQKRFELKDA